MTLHTFIKTIKTAGNIPGSLENIAADLYQYSEIFYAPASIKAALSNSEKKKRHPLPKDQDLINERGFLRFFEERTASTWLKMQAAFGELDKYDLIDRDTNDRYIFYESLLILFYEILRLVPVSLLDILPQAPLVFGRETTLEQIEKVFERSGYAILTGIGGIGKSCTALAYAHALKKSGHWSVQHIICENSDTLRTAILKLQFNRLIEKAKGARNTDKENLVRKVNCLKNSRKRILIILDNLSHPFTTEDYDAFKKINGYSNHVRILITSRNTLIDDKQCVVSILPLDDDALLEFYAYHRFEDSADHKDYIAQRSNILMALFRLLGKHTLMIELLAKLPSRTSMNEEEIYDRLVSGLSVPSEGIEMKKDGSTINISPAGLVKMLFDISDLTDREKSVMRYMTFIPAGGINIGLFEELTHYARQEILKLRMAHWIMMDEENFTIRLHPLICEAILSFYNTELFDDARPFERKYTEFINLVKKKRDMFELGSSEWHTFNRILGCYAENVYFRPIASTGFIDCLKDENRESLLFINKEVINYLNADS